MLLALKMKNVCGGSGKVREVAGGGGGGGDGPQEDGSD